MKNFICKLFSPLWDNPRNGVFLVLIFTVAAWTIQCSCLQSVLGLDVLEAISWGKNYDTWGNVKHPPLSGWIALAFTTLSGGRDWSLYLAAQLSLATGIWFTYLL
jgi:4-amino-4-deoxy-L-arabinose transferase-like glycosyltransferase